VAQSLYRVRQLLGEDLAEQVSEISREMDMQADVLAQGPNLDRSRLRGIPAVGRGVSGHIEGTDPLEALLDKYPEEAA
jgi:hypothetical protein